MTESVRHPAREAIDRLLHPRSIAVVGSLREARFGGYVVDCLAIAEEMNREFESIGLPAYPDGDAAIKALSVAARYARIRAGLGGTGRTIEKDGTPRPA